MDILYTAIGFVWFCIVLGLISLIAIMVWLVRRAMLGNDLLDACADDWPTARLAIVNVRQDAELMRDAIVRDFNKGDGR